MTYGQCRNLQSGCQLAVRCGPLLNGAEIMSSSRRPRDLAIRENVPLQPSTWGKCKQEVQKAKLQKQ